MKFHNCINVIEDPTSAASLDPIKIPLCAYVEEEEVVEEPSQIVPAVNQTENKAFLDPHLGTVFPFHWVLSRKLLPPVQCPFDGQANMHKRSSRIDCAQSALQTP